MKKNRILFFMLILVLTVFTTRKVYADYVNVSLDYLSYNNGERNLWVYKHISGDDPYYKIRAGGEVSYCMEVGVDLDPRYPYDSTTAITLESFLEGKVDESKKESLIKKINNYLYFGYKTGDTYSDDNQATKYELATQKLIWDAIYDAGYRTSNYTKSMVYYLGEYPLDANNEPRFTPYSAKIGDDLSVTTEMNAIKSKINNYTKTPSFCSSSVKLEIAVGETATYKDTNKVLSNFTVNCSDGIKCQVSGNELKVTANKVGADHQITFTKTGGGAGAKIFNAAGQQAIVLGEGKVAPVSCEFGVDTYENVETGSAQLIIFALVGVVSFFVGYTVFLGRVKKGTDQSA